jgi:hypothetical protein
MVSCHALGVLGKISMKKGVSSWFHNVSTYNEEVIENKIFMKIHLNETNYNGNLGPLLILLEKN